MKDREDLVFDKTTGLITGFVDYGKQSLDERFSALQEECTWALRFSALQEECTWTLHFSALQEECTWTLPLRKRTVATHMLTMMVRGIFFKMTFPLCHFATTGMIQVMYYSGISLLWIIWDPEFLATFCYNIEVFLFQR